tara:strand:- start:160 stop:345 length:186 start_codon:yes stop_codon:yes gene_type:complete
LLLTVEFIPAIKLPAFLFNPSSAVTENPYLINPSASNPETVMKYVSPEVYPSLGIVVDSTF